MSTKKKLLTALIVFLIAVASRVLCLFLSYYYRSGDTFLLPMLVSAVMYAVFYDKLVFRELRFISALVHLVLWLGIDVIYILSMLQLERKRFAGENFHSIAVDLQIWLCFWILMFVLSLIIIGIRKKIQKAEHNRMIKEIMEKNQESNFKEKNDV